MTTGPGPPARQRASHHDLIDTPDAEAPSSWWRRYAVLGPGMVVAAYGVGAGDMVVGLSSGVEFGMAFAWAAVVGAGLKFIITEGIGRWYLATGITPLKGIHSLGRWASGYFIVYLTILAFIYGASVTSATALAVNAMWPIIPVPAWAVVIGVIGFGIVWIGRYSVFENIMKVFVIVMFVGVVGTALITLPGLSELLNDGGFRPRLPSTDGSLIYVLGVMGGVGATLSLTSYGYWLRDKGWRRPSWIPVMRIDLATAYATTSIFVLAMMVVGTELLFGTGRSVSGEAGLTALANPLGDRFGQLARWLFLLGFFGATFSSVVGGWNALSYLFADFVRIARRIPDSETQTHTSVRSPAFRIFLAWSAFPPMLLHAFGQPVFLVLIYGMLGALSLPFLVIVLMWLLNSRRVPVAHRNGWIGNTAMTVSLLVFGFLGLRELAGALL